jgi:predicted alpha/beta superfamily hydrolase
VAPPAAASATGSQPERREFTLPGTEVRPVHAESTGKDYELLIGLPPSFEKETDRKYPTLLLLDGQWDFPLVNTLAGGLRFDQVMPEMLIVGIAYGGKNPDYDELRADDYLPTHARSQSGKQKGGGAARFLTWLETTVIPMLARDYRADSEHLILAGTSYGGLFTLFAMFERSDLFESYIAICPSVQWDERYMFRLEQEFHKAHPRLERRLWLSSGGAEWPAYLKSELAFFHQIRSSSYRGLILRTHQAVGERHAGLKPESFNRALRFVSEPYR